ncbi:MAG TPA: GerMN domain-containing protein [Acidimicrobiales bacterium]
MRSPRVLLGLVASAVLLSGCSLVATTSSPQKVNKKNVPFGLLGKTIPGTDQGRVAFKTQPVYIVDVSGHLSASSRIVPSPPVLASVLRQLILGPTRLESKLGYTSALPRTMELLSASLRNGIGYVDLSTSLGRMSRAEEVLAVGQLVLTAHDVGATRGLEISVAGVAQSSPLPNGQSQTLVRPSYFQSLLNN